MTGTEFHRLKRYVQAWAVFVEWRDLPAVWAVNRAIEMLKSECGAEIVHSRGRIVRAYFSNKDQAVEAHRILSEIYNDEFVWATIRHSMARNGDVNDPR